jgi:hypothetical protein
VNTALVCIIILFCFKIYKNKFDQYNLFLLLKFLFNLLTLADVSVNDGALGFNGSG